MSYTDYELSPEDGLPIELYQFALNTQVWRFTSGMENIMHDGHEYLAVPIKRGETEDVADATKANLEITIARNSTMGDMFKVTPPSEYLTVTILQYHDGMNLNNAQNKTIVVWKGRVTNFAWRGDEIVMTGESIFSSLQRLGATRTYSRACSHTLYGTRCRVNRDNFAESFTPTSVIGLTLGIATGKTAKWFAGGYLTYRNADTGVLERRAIVESTPTSVTVNAIPVGLVANATEVTLYAGCDHTHTTCDSKFNNVENFGGQPFIPIVNIFNGHTIY